MIREWSISQSILALRYIFMVEGLKQQLNFFILLILVLILLHYVLLKNFFYYILISHYVNMLSVLINSEFNLHTFAC